MPIQVPEASRTPNRPNQNRTSPQHIIVKTLSTENKERILKAAREKCELTYNGKPIRITADLSTEAIKASRPWQQVLQALEENDFKPSLLYPA
jgi:hypothetical protein